MSRLKRTLRKNVKRSAPKSRRMKRPLPLDDTVISPDDGLTAKKRAFCEEYVTCWNGAEAARRGGYAENRARQEAWRLRTNGYIRAYIDKRLAAMVMSADEVLARLSDQATATLDDFFSISKNGAIKIDLKKAKERDVLHLLKKYVKGRQGVRIELHDAQAAQVHLGRHYGLFGDRNTSLNIDMSKLTDEQIDRIANGEDPLRVIADSGQGRAGTPATPDPEPRVT